jgi:PmbA protein
VLRMAKKDLMEKIFDKGREYGLKDMEIYLGKGSSFRVRIHKGEIDNYSVSSSEGLSLRGEYNGQMGYAHTSKLDESSVEMLARNAKENAEVLTNEDKEVIFEGSPEYKLKDTYSEKLDRVTEKEKIEFAKEMEAKAYAFDKRIESVPYCYYGDSSGETLIKNTKGLELFSKNNMAYCIVNVVASDGNDKKSGTAYRCSGDFYTFNAEEIAREACENAISLLGGKSVKSGSYPVLMDREAVIDLFSACSDIFNAELVQKGLSLLKGKLGEAIASEKISFIDDPFIDMAAGYRAFDDEGVACRYKKIVDKGVLTTYFHNLKTALTDGTETTGNAYRASYSSSISIAPTNFYIENGDTDVAEMLNRMGTGIMITEIEGLHAGLNTVSGDFSLSARGFYIKNGKKERPVEQITVSGNYLTLLKDVAAVGNDFKFGMPDGGGYKGAPSLLIEKLSVAGE